MYINDLVRNLITSVGKLYSKDYECHIVAIKGDWEEDLDGSYSDTPTTYITHSLLLSEEEDSLKITVLENVYSINCDGDLIDQEEINTFIIKDGSLYE